MDVVWFRDLVVSVLGVVAIGALIFISILSFKLYHRIRSILDSIKATSRTAQTLSSYLGEEVAKPVIQLVALVQGIRQGVDAVSKLFGRKGGRHG